MEFPKTAADGLSSEELAARIIAYESGNDLIGPANGPQRVFEKMRLALVTLLGPLGFRALIMRALTLARREAPPLECLHIEDDGTLAGPESEPPLEVEVLIRHLISLLMSFVGVAITFRLLQDLWPKLDDVEASAGEAK